MPPVVAVVRSKSAPEAVVEIVAVFEVFPLPELAEDVDEPKSPLANPE